MSEYLDQKEKQICKERLFLKWGFPTATQLKIRMNRTEQISIGHSIYSLYRNHNLRVSSYRTAAQ
jgi:hypothetical protein